LSKHWFVPPERLSHPVSWALVRELCAIFLPAEFQFSVFKVKTPVKTFSENGIISNRRSKDGRYPSQTNRANRAKGRDAKPRAYAFMTKVEEGWPPGYRTATITKEKSMNALKMGLLLTALMVMTAISMTVSYAASSQTGKKAGTPGKSAMQTSPVETKVVEVKIGNAMLEEYQGGNPDNRTVTLRSEEIAQKTSPKFRGGKKHS